MAGAISPTEAKKIKEIIDDPVKWAQVFVVTYDAIEKKKGPWKARWYQAEMLRDRSLRKVYRCGRRTGKCLPGWTKVYDPVTGENIKVEELYKRGYANILALNKKEELVKHQTPFILKNGVKKVFRVTLESGRQIDATGNHPLYSHGKYVPIEKLKVLDEVAIASELCFGENENKKEEAENLKTLFERGNFRFFNINDARDVQHRLLKFSINSKIIDEDKYQKVLVSFNDYHKFLYYILELNEYKNSDTVKVIYEKIQKIEYIGLHETYDLSVPEYHNFVAEDFVTHNTETMCIEILWQVMTKSNFRCLIITPYESQVNLIFMRLKELIADSPLIAQEVERSTSSPYMITFKNSSAIMGFTTGASSKSGAASVRGQRGDAIYLDETDYMAQGDFDTITAIALERSDISITMSSTPTGARGHFYMACTDKRLSYSEHHHPSTHNPNWGASMEAEFRAQLSEQGYVHEVLAEFGEQDTGVFDKAKVDEAMNFEYYYYTPLDYYQIERVKNIGIQPISLNFPEGKRAPANPFRCMGVDFDKYGASSSILILDYNMNYNKFQIVKRIEVPRGEYSYDNALNMIVALNEQYNPSWIYCDRGSGEYIIERLHIIGDERPTTGLKNKVKGWQFKNTVEITDPVTREVQKYPMKPFMVNQLQISFERSRMILSPFDEILHKQLIDYCVVKIGSNGNPIYSSENEHFVDALGLAHLAFVLEFPNLTSTIKEIENTTKIIHSNKQIGGNSLKQMFAEIGNTNSSNANISKVLNYDPTERDGDRQRWVKVDQNYRSGGSSSSWGSRSSGGSRRAGPGGRNSW